MKLYVKTTAIVAILFTLSMAIGTFFLSYTFSKDYKEQIKKEANQTASSFSNFLAYRLSYYSNEVMTLSRVMSTFENVYEDNRRNVYSNILNKIFSENENIISVYTYWDLDTIDKQGNQYYFNVNRADGFTTTIYTPIDSIDIKDWYISVKEKSSMFISEPTHTMYNDSGEKYYVVTIAAPITNLFGNFQGVIAIDVNVESLISLADSIKPYETGYAFIVSPSGTFVSHPKKDVIGKKIHLIDPETNKKYSVLTNIQDGKVFGFEKKALVGNILSYTAFAPIHISGFETPYSLGISVPITTAFRIVEKQIINSVILTIIIIILSISALFIFLFKSLKPISVTTTLLKGIASGSGDLTKKLDIKNKDELGELAKSFNTFTEELKKIVVSIKENLKNLANTNQDFTASIEETSSSIVQMNSNTLNSVKQVEKQTAIVEETIKSVEGISKIINSLDNKIDDQAASIAEGSSSIEEIVQNIKSITSNTNTTFTLTEEMKENLNSILKEFHFTKDSVDLITAKQNSLAEISEILSDIGGKINILSMNAAIEAAHSASAGKGFAVVADEMRKLGSEVQNEAKKAKEVLKNVSEVIDKLNKSMESAAIVFQGLTNSINNVYNSVNEITHAMEEQNKGGNEIVIALKQMNDTTQAVQDGSRGIRANLIALNKVTADLKNISFELINNFKELSIGITESNKAIQLLQEGTVKVGDNIYKVDAEVNKFKTE